MKTVAIIPVRGGSKSIPLKNIKNINGRPLVYWTIDAAIQCRWIDKVYVSTDNLLIKDCVEKYDQETYGKLDVVNRSPYTATDIASTESVMLEFIKKIDSDYIVLLQATSPLTQSKDLDEAFQKMINQHYDSILSCVRQKRFLWKENQNGSATFLNYMPSNRPRRQEFEGFLVENGAFYITKTVFLEKNRVRISGNIGLFEMSEETYFEIDEPSDWEIIEKLMQQREIKNKKNSFNLSKIKLFATDCDGVLSDGGMYYSKDGEIIKKFNTKDGMGFELLKKRGIITAILTGEDSEIVLQRAKKLKINEVYLGCKDKLSVMKELIKKYQLNFSEVAYVGDDLNDLELLKKVGLSFAVADAVEQVKNNVDYITNKKGGEGAVREAVEYILHQYKEE